MDMSPNKLANRIIIVGLLALWAGITAVKFGYLNYRLEEIVPHQAHEVVITTQGQGYGSDVSIEHMLPVSGLGQQVSNEQVTGSFTRYEIPPLNGNRHVEFTFAGRYGPLHTRYAFRVKTKEVEYDLPPYWTRPATVAPRLRKHLVGTDLIQKDDPLIAEVAAQIGLEGETDAVEIVRKAYDYAYREIRPAGFSGETDAVLTCKLGEASCNGKSRLMVALCRRAGVPARLVGGLILAGGTKRTTHQWVEAYIDNVWVAFCPLNGYFATKPASYLACYRGDHAYFTHTTDINFDYSFSVARKLVPRHEDFGGHKALDIVNVWNAFENAGIPLHALSVVLVIPIGALVTIIFRNVIGVQTFGTFLPALIAYAFLRTGILWGGGIFVTIIVLGAGLDWVLSRLRLLHTPRLTLLMVFSVVALLTLGMLGIVIGNDHVAHSFFFPLAILSITVERFFVIAQERGTRHSLSILMFTMIVAAFCYMVMSSVFLQVMVVVLPETYLLIVACVLYLGHWTGLRVSEFVRFRGLVFGEEPRVAEGTKG